MYDFTVFMALVDYIPVVFFGITAGDSTVSWVNWLEQCINIVSQGCPLGGVWMLHKAGLRKVREAV